MCNDRAKPTGGSSAAVVRNCTQGWIVISGALPQIMVRVVTLNHASDL